MRQGIKEKDIRDMQKCFDKLSELSKRIQEYNPDARVVIIESDTIALTGNRDYEINDEIVAEAYIRQMDTFNFA